MLEDVSTFFEGLNAELNPVMKMSKDSIAIVAADSSSERITISEDSRKKTTEVEGKSSGEKTSCEADSSKFWSDADGEF